MVRTIADKRNPFGQKKVGTVSFTIGAETSNAITVNVVVKDASGVASTVRTWVNWFLSSDANGDTKAAAASGGVAIGTNGHLTALVTGVSGWAFSEANGTIDFVITDTTTRNVYLNILLPDGTVATSSIIAFA